MTTTPGNTPPGWYDDSHGALRWFDGTAWTEHVHPLPDAAAEVATPEPALSPADAARAYLPPAKTYAPVPDEEPAPKKPFYARPLFVVLALVVVVAVLAFVLF